MDNPILTITGINENHHIKFAHKKKQDEIYRKWGAGRARVLTSCRDSDIPKVRTRQECPNQPS